MFFLMDSQIRFPKRKNFPCQRLLTAVLPLTLLFLGALYSGFLPSVEPLFAQEKGTKSLSTSNAALAAGKPVFLVQLVSFRRMESAQRFAASLKEKGYPAYSVSTGNRKPWYKVRLGPYANRSEAGQVAKKVKHVEGVMPIILKGEPDSRRTIASLAPRAKTPGLGVFQRKPSQGKKSSRKVRPPVASKPPGFKSLKNAEGLTPLKPTNSQTQGDPVDIVVSQFLVWLKVWQDKNVDSYLSFYSRDFKASGLSPAEWKKARMESLRKNDQIKIEVSDIHMKKNRDTVEMSFIQDYQSKNYSDVSDKTLVWKKEGDHWKIISEYAKPI